MTQKKPFGRHAIGSFFTILIFGMFVFFLMIILLFSARMYQKSVAVKDRTQNLYTASAYLETKFRQHDAPALVDTGFVGTYPALIFHDTVDGEHYETAIYLHGSTLRELFFRENSPVSPDVGVALAELSSFDFAEKESYWTIHLQDLAQESTDLLMHPGLPSAASF